MYLSRMVLTILLITATPTKAHCSEEASFWEENKIAMKDAFDLHLAAFKHDEESLEITIPVISRHPTRRLCDVVAILSASRGVSSSLEMRYFSQDIFIEAKSKWDYAVTFYKSDLPTGYKYIDSSIRVEMSCHGVKEGVEARSVSSAYTICDPSLALNDHCQNTCQASIYRPNTCASDKFRWSPDITTLIEEADPLDEKIGFISFELQEEILKTSIEFVDIKPFERSCQFDLKLTYNDATMDSMTLIENTVVPYRTFVLSHEAKLERSPRKLSVLGYCIPVSENSYDSNACRQDDAPIHCVNTCVLDVEVDENLQIVRKQCRYR